MNWLDILSLINFAVAVGVSILLLIFLKVFCRGPLALAPLREGPVSFLWLGGTLLLYIAAAYVALMLVSSVHAVDYSAGSAHAPLNADMMAREVMEQIANALGELGACAVVALVLGSRMAGGYKGWGIHPRQIPRGILAGITAMVIIYPLLDLVGQLSEFVLQLFHKRIIEHPIFDLLQNNPTFWQQFVLVVSPALIAPPCEELFFRGILQSSLIQRGWGILKLREVPYRGFELLGLNYGLPSPAPLHRAATPFIPSAGRRWIAIIITAALFAGAHWSPTNFPILFVLGIALGYTYERTGNLWASITLHMLFNITNLTLFFTGGGG